jgi:hypothetical protein
MRLWLPVGLFIGIVFGALGLVGVFRHNPLAAYRLIFPVHDLDASDKIAEQHCNERFPFYVDRRLPRAEAKLDMATEGYGRSVQMSDLAVLYVDEDRAAEAKDYADKLLAIAEDHRMDWNYSNAVHSAHTTFGRIAVREGNLDKAVRHLEASVTVNGSPQLNSFGPRLILADELYAAGRVTEVIQFLELSRQFFSDDVQI